MEEADKPMDDLIPEEEEDIEDEDDYPYGYYFDVLCPQCKGFQITEFLDYQVVTPRYEIRIFWECTACGQHHQTYEPYADWFE